MKQLVVKDIFDCVNRLQKSGMNFNDIMELPIYLGNDDELNGIHNGWYCQAIDSNNADEDTQYILEMIEEDYATTTLNGKGILIS